jgi:NTP pyrophosphatase (non-canonical NTP hydrolase)
MTTTEETHMKMVSTLVKSGDEIILSLTPAKAHLLHMSIGVAGEAGELLDAIKKWVIYGKPLDRENVIEELGDIEFYLQGIRETLDIAREHTLAANLVKLSKRYGEKLRYSDAAAVARADKVVLPFTSNEQEARDQAADAEGQRFSD